MHTGDRIFNKIKSGDIPQLYYSSKTDYLFFEGDYLSVGYAQVSINKEFFESIENQWKKQDEKEILYSTERNLQHISPS